jgi:hypothetical protein
MSLSLVEREPTPGGALVHATTLGDVRKLGADYPHKTVQGSVISGASGFHVLSLPVKNRHMGGICLDLAVVPEGQNTSYYYHYGNTVFTLCVYRLSAGVGFPREGWHKTLDALAFGSDTTAKYHIGPPVLQVDGGTQLYCRRGWTGAGKSEVFREWLFPDDELRGSSDRIAVVLAIWTPSTINTIYSLTCSVKDE